MSSHVAAGRVRQLCSGTDTWTLTHTPPSATDFSLGPFAGILCGRGCSSLAEIWASSQQSREPDRAGGGGSRGASSVYTRFLGDATSLLPLMAPSTSVSTSQFQRCVSYRILIRLPRCPLATLHLDVHGPQQSSRLPPSLSPGLPKSVDISIIFPIA